jgi:hypothetical protein
MPSSAAAEPQERRMAVETFPKLPIRSWWTLREAFNRRLPGKITRNYLATVLHVTEATAGNILPELRQLGLVDENDGPSDWANKWRFDEDYPDICHAILEKVYPAELSDSVPNPSENLNATVRWFQRHAGVGENAAKNMARLYAVISEADPLKRPDDTKPGKEPREPKRRRAERKTGKESAAPPALPHTPAPPVHQPHEATPSERHLSLHIDLQVHISPESTPEQIEQIFKSIRKHLYGE